MGIRSTGTNRFCGNGHFRCGHLLPRAVDGLSPQNTGAPADFSVYFSVETGPYGLGCATCSTPHGANFYHPWETPGVDSAFFWDANSWFNPIGQADNWLMFGPITIPAGGATLKWFDRTARYRDGYQVLVSSTFSPVLDFGDFTGAAIFTETDDAAPSATYAIDTTWELKSVAIPASFNGMQIAFAFHHNAYDMDQLWLDEIHITEVQFQQILEKVKQIRNTLTQNI